MNQPQQAPPTREQQFQHYQQQFFQVLEQIGNCNLRQEELVRINRDQQEKIQKALAKETGNLSELLEAFKQLSSILQKLNQEEQEARQAEEQKMAEAAAQSGSAQLPTNVSPHEAAKAALKAAAAAAAASKVVPKAAKAVPEAAPNGGWSKGEGTIPPGRFDRSRIDD